MKKCCNCTIEKSLTEFRKYNRSKDGHKSRCKTCDKKYYAENKEKLNSQTNQYYKDNKDKIKRQRKQYLVNNIDKIKAKRKEYYAASREKILLQQKGYRVANKARRNEYVKKRKQTDYLFKLKLNLSTRNYQAFKRQGYSKNTKTQEMLGVDWNVAKKHIERQFTKGMSWDNYGQWHIDHIIPLASANTEERIKQLCHYSNLQPMWAEENLSKADKIINQQTKIRI